MQGGRIVPFTPYYINYNPTRWSCFPELQPDRLSSLLNSLRIISRLRFPKIMTNNNSYSPPHLHFQPFNTPVPEPSPRSYSHSEGIIPTFGTGIPTICLSQSCLSNPRGITLCWLPKSRAFDWAILCSDPTVQLHWNTASFISGTAPRTFHFRCFPLSYVRRTLFTDSSARQQKVGWNILRKRYRRRIEYRTTDCIRLDHICSR
jgi:hypothetical protein